MKLLNTFDTFTLHWISFIDENLRKEVKASIEFSILLALTAGLKKGD